MDCTEFFHWEKKIKNITTKGKIQEKDFSIFILMFFPSSSDGERHREMLCLVN